MGIRKQRPRDRDAGSTDLVDQRTGWQLVDALLTFALSPERERLNLLIDATPAGTVLVTPQRLVAANASCTVELPLSSALCGSRVARRQLPRARRCAPLITHTGSRVAEP